MIIVVDDPNDERLDRFRWRERQLASRTERMDSVGAGLFIAEGDLVVERAIAAGCEPVAMLCDERAAVRYEAIIPRIEIFLGPESLRRDVTGLGVPLGAAGLFRRPPLRRPDDVMERSRWVVVIEQVDNPTNLGAIARTAVALGFEGLIMDHGSADPLARRALRVSMGAALALPHARLAPSESISDLLARHPSAAYALTPDPSATDIASVDASSDDRVVVMLGSERHGLSAGTLDAAMVRVRVPMHAGVDSLNVGAAAAIAFHALGPNSAR